jgi:hypothetical protein
MTNSVSWKWRAVGMAAILVLPGTVVADSAAPVATVTNVYAVTNGIHTNEVALGNSVYVEVANLAELPRAVASASARGRIGLVLGDIPLEGLCKEAGVCSNIGVARFRFDLVRSEACRAAWAKLFGAPKATVLSNMLATVELGDDCPLPSTGSGTSMNVVILPRGVLTFWCGFFLVYLVTFVWLGKYSDLLRDLGPQNPADRRKSYSLARCQMGWWLLIVVPAFVFLWLVTEDLNVLNASVLTLIGISAGTSLGARVQDKSKEDDSLNDLLEERKMLLGLPQRSADQTNRLTQIDQLIAQRPPQYAPTSENFLKDILTDASGVSLHRLQMAIWTVVLGIIFVVDVWCNLAMPEFDATILGLMGISSGTYLGFMLTEPHTSTQSKPAAGNGIVIPAAAGGGAGNPAGPGP